MVSDSSTIVYVAEPVGILMSGMGEAWNSSASLTQFVRDASHYLPVTHDVTALERPPLLSVVGDERLRGR